MTVSVFLRDMQTVWPGATPDPAPKVKELMAKLEISDLEEYAREHGIDPVRLETALCRYTRDKVLTERANADRKWKDRYKPQALR